MRVTDGKEFTSYMRTVRKRTLEVVRAVPPERTNWRMSGDSMSVIEIVQHIASVEKALWGAALAREMAAARLDEFPRDSMDMATALTYMKDVRAGSEVFWSGLGIEKLREKVKTPTGDLIQLDRWLVLAAEHEIHHRGFIHAYRKIWGLSSSPIYGLTYEDLKQLLAR
ncbi:MAG: DinB family protein [Leptospirales bacterium]|nr:DinB family protein [Leptospirales bacterium]